MKAKRKKNLRQGLRFYRLNFGFNEPVQILMDGNFLTVALHQKIDVKEDIPKLLGAKTRVCITPCIVAEIRKLGPDFSGTAVAAKRLARVQCKHQGGENALSARECILSLAKQNGESKYPYMVATQDWTIKAELKRVPGVPLLYIDYNVVLMEPPSDVSQRAVVEIQEKKQLPNSVDSKLMKEKKAGEELKARKKRKEHGPNPLSVKKKKQKTEPTDTEQPKQKRQRNRVRKSRVKKEENDDRGALPDAGGLHAE